MYLAKMTKRSIIQKTYQSRIERAMLVGCAVVLDVVEHLIRNLEDGLVHDILVGPRAELSANKATRNKYQDT